MTPTAVFAFVWDFENGEPPLRMFTVIGGPLDRSTVSEQTLAELGIPIPEAA